MTRRFVCVYFRALLTAPNQSGAPPCSHLTRWVGGGKNWGGARIQTMPPLNMLNEWAKTSSLCYNGERAGAAPRVRSVTTATVTRGWRRLKEQLKFCCTDEERVWKAKLFRVGRPEYFLFQLSRTLWEIYFRFIRITEVNHWNPLSPITMNRTGASVYSAWVINGFLCCVLLLSLYILFGGACSVPETFNNDTRPIYRRGPIGLFGFSKKSSSRFVTSERESVT